MLGETLTVTINSVPHDFVRIQQSGELKKTLTTFYQTADGTKDMYVSQQVTSADRVRTNVRIVLRKVVTDPVSSANDSDDLTMTYGYDRPSFGFTVDEVKQLTAGLKTLLSDAFVTKLYGKES